MLRGICGAALAVLVWGVSTAQAGSPRVLDPQGTNPHGVTDPSGALHVAWTHQGGAGENDTIRFCTVPRGTGGCGAAPRTLAVPPPYDANVSDDNPFVYRQGSTLRVGLFVSNVGRYYVWTAPSLAGEFGPAVLEADFGFLLGGQSEPGVQQGAAVVFGAGRRVHGLTFGGGVAMGGDFAVLTDPGDSVAAQSDVDRAPSGEYVAVDRLITGSRVPVWVDGAGAGVNTAANWRITQELASDQPPRLVRTPAGLFAVTELDATGRVSIHRFDPATDTFGPGTPLPGPLKDWSTLNVAAGGGRILVAADTTSGGPIGLQLWRSGGLDGTGFGEPAAINPSNEPGYFNVQLAVADDGQGWVMYDDNLGTATVEDLTTVGADPAAGSLHKGKNVFKKVTLFGSELTFVAPKDCIPQDRRFRMAFSAKDVPGQAAKGTVKPIAAIFQEKDAALKDLTGPGRRSVDKSAPYVTQSLSTAGLAKGSTFYVRTSIRYRRVGAGSAAAQAKVRRGGINRKLKVCG